MRKQLKSAGVAVQPNLFHLWNISGKVQVDELKSDEAGPYGCASSSPSSGAAAELGVSVEIRSPPQPQSHNVICPTESPGFESIPAHGESIPNPSEGTPPGSSGNGKRRGQLVNDNSQSRYDSHKPDSTPKRPYEDQPRRNTRTLSVGKKRHVTSSEVSQTRLFPLFMRSDHQEQTAMSVAEATSRTDNGLEERRDQGADSSELPGKRPVSVLRAPSSVRTAGGPVSVRPCSQPLPSSQTTDGAIEESVSRLLIHIEVAGSQEEPIVIDSSPVRDLREHCVPEPPLSPVRSCPSDRNEAFTSFFAKRKQGSAPNLSKVQKRVHRENDAKWPDRDEQHVRGPQRAFSCASLKFVRSNPRPCAGDPSISLSESVRCLRIGNVSRPHHEPRYLVEPIGSQPDGHARCENILQSSATCPAISRFLSADYDTSGSSWNERWRPRRAAEVIGNEATSKYLRDWLRAQEIRAQDHDLRRENSGSTADVSAMLSRNVKRPKVIRSVERARKRRRRAASDEESLGDWITEDDEEEEEEETTPSPTFAGPTNEDWPDQNECGSPWKPKLTRLSRRRPPDNNDKDSQTNDEVLSPRSPSHGFSDRLTNTILLAGPSGSGKTAAVYACAEELGWEVFEVYPGIGKRNGASLLSLVGDVGKNHIVNRDSRSSASTYEKRGSSPSLAGQMSAESKKTSRKPVPQAFASFYNPVPNVSANSTARRHSGLEEKSVNVEERETPEFGHVRSFLDPSAGHDCAPTSSEKQDSRRDSTRQSIILLEEVDILYAEDVNFWSTVVTLIRESRRPVIMTCNDSNLVPSVDLPLQTTLTFNPCPLELAVSYLQCLALVEGYSIAVEHTKSLYECRHSSDALGISDDLTRPPVYPSSSPDLRHAINSLQFLCQGSPGFEDASSPTGMDTESRKCDVQQGDGILDDPIAWDWSQHIPSGPSPTPCGHTNHRKQDGEGISRLWQTSDVLSMIDCDLSRNSLANLEIRSYSKGPPSDDELGYRYLEYEPNVQHLQDGIALHNHDEAIATEAVSCARRLVGCDTATAGAGRITTPRTEQGWKPTYIEMLLGRSRHFACVSGALDRVSPGVSRESSAALILDYEPWVRLIDRSDMLLEAAAQKDSEARTGARGGRSTRNSQRTQYQRYFDLGDEERANWHSDTLCGGMRDCDL